jgi:hypothetical protein
MVDFYRRLYAGEQRAEALRHARLAMKAGKYPDPFYWGAFICQGEPSPIKGARPSGARRLWRWLTRAVH